MAKKPETTAPAPANGPAPADPTEIVLTYGDYKLAVADVSPKGIAYLLQNGFSQSLTDAAAFTKEQKTHKNDDGTTRPKTDDEIASMQKEARDKRFAAIKAGEVGSRVGGPKLPQIDRVMREVAEERLRAIASAKSVAMPKGDVLKAALDKILARDPDGIRAEAQTRIDNAKAIVPHMDDDDLFISPAAA